MRYAALSTVVALLTITTACIGPQQYRHVKPPAVAPNTPLAQIERVGPRAATAYVEFDDNGQPYETAQLDEALRLIAAQKKLSEENQAIVLLYVHGWKNSANAAPAGKRKDVEKFRVALDKLAALTTEWAERDKPRKPLPIAAIYIGWRGGSVRLPSLLSWPSFWGRRGAARNVGGDKLTSALDRIMETARQDSPNTRVVLIGHSFGALVLERAMAASKHLAAIDRMPPTGSKPLADLVVYVNSANDAVLTSETIDRLRRSDLVVRHPSFDPQVCANGSNADDPRCRPYPLFVAVTSRGDAATKYLLLVGQFLSSWFRKGGPEHTDETFDDGRVPSTARLARHSAGHTRFLQSHDVKELPCPKVIECPAGTAFCFESVGDCRTCYSVAQRTGKPWNTSPFWVMAVDQPVIKDHGDIWNLSFMNMLFGLMGEMELLRPAAGSTSVMKR
jgi:hypothetical protein